MSRLDGTATATIAQGATTSNAIYLGGAVPYALQLPAANWVAGNITFQGSVDGLSFYDLYKADAGTEAKYTITSAATGSRVYSLDGTVFAGLNAIKVVGAVQTNVGGVVVGVGLRDL